MSYIKNLINDVEKTHKNFGKLVAVCQIAVKARKFVLIVSPSGCGKSRAMEFIFKNTADAYSPTSLSVASLASKEERLCSFRSVITIDDIASIQTLYGRTATINTLSQLVYSHRIEHSMAGFEFCIDDFYGSALVGIQPVLLKDLMLSPEWDASIQDKALRYYHLFRPTEPNINLPVAQYEKGIDIEQVEDFNPNDKPKLWQKLTELGETQWSKARIREHFIDMLKAIAALEHQKQVEDSHYLQLIELLKPMVIEGIAVHKEQLEGERYLDNDLLVLLTEYYTYGGEFSLKQVLVDSRMTQLSLSQGYRIMQSQNGNWQQISKSPTKYRPSKKLEQVLKLYNMEVKSDS